MEVKPCPCCGNPDLYVGVLSSDTHGVHCLRGSEDIAIRWMVHFGHIKGDEGLKGCGLKMEVPIPDDYPDDFPEDLVGYDAVDKLAELTLAEAVRRWNMRGET